MKLLAKRVIATEGWPFVKIDQEWFGLHEAKFRVSTRFYHQHADLVQFRHPEVIESIVRSLEMPTTVACYVRNKGGGQPGISATHFNSAIRESMTLSGFWGFEALHEANVVFDHASFETAKTQGYDFAAYDIEANVRRLWNYCFGRVHLHEGEKMWKKHRLNPKWKTEMEKLEHLNPRHGIDLAVNPTTPTILGEIQCGNWALVNNDFKKIIKSSAESDVGLFVYVTPTGNLEKMLSDGIVSFHKTRMELESSFGRVITAPILVLGLSIGSIGARMGAVSSAVEKQIGGYKNTINSWDKYEASGLDLEAPDCYLGL